MRSMRNLLKRLALASVLATASCVSFAQETSENKPVVVVSIAPLAKTMPDISYIMRSAGAGGVSGMMSAMVNTYSAGLDNKRPAGVLVSMGEDQTPIALAFLPLSDLDAFFASFETTFGEPDDLGDGMHAMTVGQQTVYALEKGEWLFVAQQEEQLESVPADPAALLTKLSERYDVGIRIDVNNIPETMKDMLISQIRDGYERGLAEQARNQSEEQAALTRATGEQSVKQIEEMMKDTEQVVLGWAVDQSSKKTYMDVGVQFVAGSRMDKEIQQLSNLKTEFAAFQNPESPFAMRMTSVMTKENAEQVMPTIRASFENALKEIEKNGENKQVTEKVTTFFKEIQKSLEATLAEGIVDGGAIVNFENGLHVVAGGRVADGKALAKSFKDVSTSFAGEPNAPVLKFDASNYKGVTFHTGTMAVPSQADDTVREIFGDNVSFVIGTGDKSAYVAIGKDCEAQLKAVLDKNATGLTGDITPLEMRVELGPVLQYVQQVRENPMIDKVVKTLEKYSDKDSILMSTRVAPRGMMYRFTVEEGVLRGAGSAQPAQGGGF
jgi:hypothetical protein